MKLFDITSKQGHHFEWRNKQHHSYTGIILPAADKYSLHGSFGNMVFQNVIRPQYQIWFSNYETKRRLYTHSRADVHLIELSLLIRNSISYELSQGKIRQKQWQFNLMNSLAMDSWALFEKDCYYTTLDFHIEERFLDALMEIYPDLLGPFVESVKSGKDTLLYSQHLYATQQIMQTCEIILHLISKRDIDIVLLDLSVTLLLGFVVNCQLDMAGSKYRYDRKQEMEFRLQGVLSHILSDLKNFHGIPYHARNAGLNATTLKQNFKKQFGTTMKQAWEKERISRCFMEVVSTSKNFEQIAFEYGFSDNASFYKTFKRHFMFPPNFFRKTGSKN